MSARASGQPAQATCCRTATALGTLDLLAQRAVRFLQFALVEQEQPRPLAVHQDHAVTPVLIEDVSEGLDVRAVGHKDAVLYRNSQRIGPPEVFFQTGKDDHSLSLPVVLKVEVFLHLGQVFRRGLIGYLLEHAFQSQSVLIFGVLRRVHVQIQAENRTFLSTEIN